MPTVFPSYPSHSIFASPTDLGPDDGSSMLSVEGYHKFLRTYEAPQAMPPPLSHTHGPTPPSAPPVPKPLTSEVTTPANDAITAQQGPSPPCQVTTFESTSTEAAPLESTSSTSAEPAPLEPTEPAPLEPTSAEPAPLGSTSTETAPLESTSSTSAQAVPSEFTSVEAAPSGKVTASESLVVSKRNEIANSIGSENTSSKKWGSSGVNGVHRNLLVTEAQIHQEKGGYIASPMDVDQPDTLLRQIHGEKDGYMARRMDTWQEGWIHGKKDGYMARRMDTWQEGWIHSLRSARASQQIQISQIHREKDGYMASKMPTLTNRYKSARYITRRIDT
ncbi:hypothetical protein EV702DRAFT_1046531 [Suillus placidus]|uniref:Uncharacterized protein n=1 Tax=Suillus placidus TaxID=48579 RepID=A0A9P6ZSB8_9AGAM|nr:hypothetical protein EV702DRAFT_1046531 [Suillus placidus]